MNGSEGKASRPSVVNRLLNIDYLLTSEEKIILKESERILEEDAGTGKATER